MSFEASGELVALLLERAELAGPIDGAISHSSPFLSSAGCLFLNVLAMYVTDAIFRQLVITVGISVLSAHSRVARIPVDHEVARLHSSEQTRGFGSGCGVAGVLILENQNDVLLRGFVCSLAHFVVDCSTIRTLIVQPPKIEDANAIGVESLRHFERTIE